MIPVHRGSVPNCLDLPGEPRAWQSDMRSRQPNRSEKKPSAVRPPQDFSELSRRILNCARRGLPRIDFLSEVSRMLLDFAGCDSVEMRLTELGKLLRCETTRDVKPSFSVETVPSRHDERGRAILGLDEDSDLERICDEIGLGRFDPSLPFYTTYGSFWIGDTDKPVELSSEACRWAGGRTFVIGGRFRSLAMIPYAVEDALRGLLLLKDRRRGYFAAGDMKHYEEITQILGIALAHWHLQVALRERVKELTCLYGLATLAARPDTSLNDILQGTVELLPPGWLYPEIASARVILDGHSYSTPGFGEGRQVLSADIVSANGEKRGKVQVAYSKEMLELDEGPFLKEERNLIDGIAREVALIVERREAEQEKEKLHEQLRHADRLATIGQLAAGVAHELNEPLGSILGFAQLAGKDSEMPEQGRKDIDSIVSASLHAREVVRKLMLFARQTPPRKDRVNLNDVVEEALYFLESRCARAGIELVKILGADLPKVTADQGQLYQVLVNLVVNAIQAMVDGGRLTIRTAKGDSEVSLVVEDTGVGMDEEALDKIFLPFYTTKDVNEGTGLGLAVVHGIVKSHGGSVAVTSSVGRGSRFEVRLPLNSPNRPKTERSN